MLYLGSFAQNLNTTSSFNAELITAIIAIETAHSKGWLNLWLETDSQLVQHAFGNKTLIAWELRNIWCNCIELMKDVNFVVSHIDSEGYSCADGLANLGLYLSAFVWSPSPPDSICSEILKNRLGLPSFMYVSS